jgi:hypothetical protein
MSEIITYIIIDDMPRASAESEVSAAFHGYAKYAL